MSRIIFLIVIIIFISNKVKVKCAPKLGPISFGPLSVEANLSRNASNKLHVDHSSEQMGKAKVHERIYNKTRKTFNENHHQLCSGYEFDETLCKTVEDRVVCGYNKNVGNITNKIIDLGNGCRIRDNRLECGYLLGPFINPRRPPVRDYISDNNDNIGQLLHDDERTYQTNLPHKSESITKKTTKADSNSSLTSNNVTTSISSSITSSLNLSMTMSSTLEISGTPTTSAGLTVNVTMSTTPLATLSSSGSISSELTKNPYKRRCVEKYDHIFCYNIQQR